MRLVCISDTHGDHAQLIVPDGDVLVHAGDATAHGTRADFREFLAWFGAQPHRHRVLVAGNHDRFAEVEPDEARRMAEAAGVVWLNDTGVEIDGVRFWGSPITLRFHDWSFMRDPGEDIDRHWRMIPNGTDVLITHGPPHGILDEVVRENGSSDNTGCPSLLERVRDVRPRLHIFGHIHECRGDVSQDETRFLNVSTMDQSYRIRHEPVIVDLLATGIVHVHDSSRGTES